MAIVNPIGDVDGWNEWVASRPPVIQTMCRSHPPDRLYRMKDTGHRVTIISYNESGTVCVDVSGEFNRVLFGRQVFGVDPADLTECDLPEPDDDVGDTSKEAGYTPEDVRDILIPKLREARKGQ